MPTYRVTAPDGRTFRLAGDSPPTEQELEEVFSNMRTGLADRKTELRQGTPQSTWSKAWESVTQSFFGSPERDEAKSAGLGVQPTTAEMGQAALTGLSMVGAPGVAGQVLSRAAPALGRIPGVPGTVARWAAAHPRTTLAAVNAAPSVAKGDLEGAAIMAGVGALEGTALGAVTKGKGSAAKAVAEKVVESAKPAKVAATVADRGRAAATAHGELMAFAKEVAQSNPKVGAKIWILLDDAGKPVKMLTSDQAGAAARKGQKTTWVRNLWQ